MHLPFSEDQRRKSSPPQRSDKNWIFDFDFPAYFTAESRGCTKGTAEFPFVINNNNIYVVTIVGDAVEDGIVVPFALNYEGELFNANETYEGSLLEMK